MNRDFIGALLQLNAEKGVPQEILIRTLEQAIESAYRRNADAPENVVVTVNPETGEISVAREYEVVATIEEIEDPELQMVVQDAQQIDPATGVGAKVRVPENVTQAQLGRIAAQTAGQVYRQRLREAQRDVVFQQYASREGEIMTGTVQRTTDSAVVLDMGKDVEAVLAVTEQLPSETYRIGQHLKVYVMEVRRTTRGPVIVASRTHRGFLRRLMEMEIPEIYNGTVVIRGIAREAGSRSKVAVESRQPGVDAKGAAVGQRGARIQSIVAELNGEKVDIVLWDEDPEAQMVVQEAQKIDPATGVGAKVRVPENVTQAQLGRIAAQTAGQVYRQRLREAQRDVVFQQYASREGEIMTGTVQRTTDSAVVLDMGKDVEAVLAVTEQLPSETYRIGQHLKVYVMEVRRTTRGPVIVASRTHRGFLRRLMEMEIPEIYNGTVVIRGIAREAGSRSKVAVESRQPGVDAKGAAVGQRGARIQSIVAELNGEKVDIVLWDEDPGRFVAEALSPAEVLSVRVDEEHKIANVIVPERQLSLAIGKEGQNARLAAKLTGWRIDIRSDAGVATAAAGEHGDEAPVAEAPADAEATT